MDPGTQEYIRSRVNAVNDFHQSPLARENDGNRDDGSFEFWEIVKSVACQAIKGVALIFCVYAATLLALAGVGGIGFLAATTLPPVFGAFLYLGTGFALTCLIGKIGRIAAEAWIQ